MSWMRRFAKMLQSAESHLAAARAWLAAIWPLAASPRALRALLNNKALQGQLRWQLRLTEALLRLAITQRANAIIAPPIPAHSGRPHASRAGLLAPVWDGKLKIARFCLDAQPCRWAISPPAGAPRTRNPQSPAHLLLRLFSLQDGFDRFEALAWQEARRRRQAGGGICGGGAAASGQRPILKPRRPHPGWIPARAPPPHDQSEIPARNERTILARLANSCRKRAWISRGERAKSAPCKMKYGN